MAVHFVCIWHLVGLDHEAVGRDRRGVGLSFFSAETYYMYISVEATAKGLIAYRSLES